MDLRDTEKRDSDMAVIRQQPVLGPGDVTGQPLSMRKGNHEVSSAVHYQDGNLDLDQFESPGFDESHLIINRASPALPTSITNGAQHKIGKVRGQNVCVSRA